MPCATSNLAGAREPTTRALVDRAAANLSVRYPDRTSESGRDFRVSQLPQRSNEENRVRHPWTAWLEAGQLCSGSATGYRVADDAGCRRRRSGGERNPTHAARESDRQHTGTVRRLHDARRRTADRGRGPCGRQAVPESRPRQSSPPDAARHAQVTRTVTRAL